MSRAWAGGTRKTNLYDEILLSIDTNPLEDINQYTNNYHGAGVEYVPNKGTKKV